MHYSPRKQIVALFSILLLLFSMALPAGAALHPLSMLQHNRTTGISDLDITISLDWDPSAVNQQVTPRGMTRSEMETAVKSYAASLYAMTNGLHRLRNVYIHKNKQSWTTADIRYIGTKAGRSSAHVAAWQVPNKQITMYVYETKTALDDYPGPVMAHECGHYIYGIFDEYREQPGKDAYTIAELVAKGWLDDPATDDDGTQPSIMNQHWNYPNWFSMAGSYAGAATKLNTAQYRAYQKSIWDTLVSAPASDPVYARAYNRKLFEAFSGKQVKAASDLKAAQTGELSGYDDALNLVWVDAPVLNLVLLDSAIPAANWKTAQNSAGAFAQRLPAGSYLQVLSGSSTGLSRSLISESNRASLASQAAAVRQTAAVSLESALQAAVAQTRAYRATLPENQVTYLYLVTASSQTVSSALINEMRQVNLAVNVLQLNDADTASASKASARPAPQAIKSATSEADSDEPIYLSQLSRETGGSFTTANSGPELENEAAIAAGASEGFGLATINESSADSLAVGRSHEMQFRVGKYDLLPMIFLDAAAEDFAKLTPGLISPAGVRISSDNLPKGITLIADPDDGVWLFMIDPDSYTAAEGTWTAVLTAREAVAGQISVMAAGMSELLLELDVLQRPVLGNLLEASLMLDRPVLQAKVRADIYDEKGKKIRTGLILSDDGKNGDLRPDDGVYTVSLNELPAGDYSFRVTADDNNGTAVASDRGTMFNPRKAATEDEATGPFQRTDEATFAVTALPSSGGDSGGCAVGNGSSSDLLLALAAIFPLLYLALPRRRENKEQL